MLDFERRLIDSWARERTEASVTRIVFEFALIGLLLLVGGVGNSLQGGRPVFGMFLIACGLFAMRTAYLSWRAVLLQRELRAADQRNDPPAPLA